MVAQFSLHIIKAIIFALEVFSWIIIADVILSYFRAIHSPIFWLFSRITEPLYELVRSYLPTRIGIIDFSPVVVLIAIDLVRSFVVVLFSPYL